MQRETTISVIQRARAYLQSPTKTDVLASSIMAKLIARIKELEQQNQELLNNDRH